jgi:perosamine synthetase
MNSIDQYRHELGNMLGVPAGRISLFWKGRVAMYAILKAAGVKEGDEVILPAFTCVVVPNAILYLGAKPVYVDIEPATYSIDVNKIEEKITSRTRVILAQNTYGLSADLDPIMSIAKKRGLLVIEDCAHGFGGSYKGKPNGTVADAAFYSSQWNKPFSTGIGGMSVVNDDALAAKVRAIEEEALKPSWKDEMMLRSLITAREKLLTPALYWSALKAYRYLGQKNILIGSSGESELSRPVFEHTFVKGLSGVQARKGMKELGRLDSNIEHRRKIASHYSALLRELGVQPAIEPSYAAHTFIKYPLLVKSRESFMREAEKNKIELADWFNSPIHPIQSNFEWWEYNIGENPVAESISAMMVNLPTHSGVNSSQLEKISSFLRAHQQYLVKKQ